MAFQYSFSAQRIVDTVLEELKVDKTTINYFALLRTQNTIEQMIDDYVEEQCDAEYNRGLQEGEEDVDDKTEESYSDGYQDALENVKSHFKTDLEEIADDEDSPLSSLAPDQKEALNILLEDICISL